jgi:hypothetical protein
MVVGPEPAGGKGLEHRPKIDPSPFPALTACIRKMVIMLNAMVRDGVMWQQKTA